MVKACLNVSIVSNVRRTMADKGRALLTYYTEQNVYSIRLARKLLKDY